VILPSQIRTVHFIGIGGVGMSALARVCVDSGYRVQGSDPSRSALTIMLEERGVRVFTTHEGANVAGADLVVVSTAIRDENPEVAAARANGTPIWHRSDVLAAILHAGEGIGVAGTHGKTTTTAMTSLVLERAGVDPTVLIGAGVSHFGGNAKTGKGPLVVAECDESDATFLKYHLRHAIVTNIEADHLENYGESMETLEAAFSQFMGQVSPEGSLVVSADDSKLRALLPKLGRSYITYGLFPRLADVRARSVELHRGGSSFRVEWRGRSLGLVTLNVPGLHNVSNALGVVAMTRSLGVDFPVIAAALAEYTGAHRRFEVKGIRSGVTIVDDYAHHPTEVAATLSAAAAGGGDGRVIGVFQPHRYSRTQLLGADFGPAFNQADQVVITDVYAAGERPIAGVTGRVVYDSIKQLGHPNVMFLPTPFEVEQHLLNTVRSGDMVLTLGAGDIYKVGEHLLQQLPA